MAPPPWVAGVLAAVLLLIAGYRATRPVAARWWRRSTDHGVDVKHVVMGVAMAGMLVPRLSLLQARAWAVLFAAGALWFGWQSLRERRWHRGHRGVGRAAAARPGLDGHHGAHALSCAAMVCMLAAGPGLRAPTAAGRGALPVLALTLAVALVISVVVSTDRLSVLRPVQAGPIAPARAPASPHTPAPAAGARPVLCPRLAASCQIMTGVAMAYMLILML